MDELIVGIIIYNYDVDNLKTKIDKYRDSVKRIVLVDNNSDNSSEIEKKIVGEKVILIKNKENLGIAYALNQILNKSYELNGKYLLTLDQDSFIELEDVNKMLFFFDEDVAIVCPEIIDLNKKKNKLINAGYVDVNRCITSGSIMNLSLCKTIGLFDEKMFIDYVDFDYCKRITINSLKIRKIGGCFLRHEVGKRTVHKFLFFYVYPTNHPPKRYYYYMRNMNYYYYKHKNNMSFFEKIDERYRLIGRYVVILLYENNKIEKIKQANNGILDSRKM